MMEKLPCFQENAAVFSRFEINTSGTGCTEKEQLSGGEKDDKNQARFGTFGRKWANFRFIMENDDVFLS